MPAGSMASLIMHFSSQAFATLSYKSPTFSRELFHIGNLLHSLSGANHTVCVFHLPFFSSNYLLPDLFPLHLECWHCVPTCLPLNISFFVSSLMSSPPCGHLCVVFASLMTGSSWKQITLFFEDSQHFWWGQTNYLPHHKQLTAGVCIDKNLRQEGDYESISQSDE